ncbi:MAG TPA: hypothetical protein VKA48_12700 [Gammaproteobacteria bacterium]|nr:hypothetical protein [Gammaproteobacteria bacterium]
MAMRVEVHNRNHPEEVFGYLELAVNELAPETRELELFAKPLGGSPERDEVHVPVEFRKVTPDLGKWIAWADRPEELDQAYGYIRRAAGS